MGMEPGGSFSFVQPSRLPPEERARLQARAAGRTDGGTLCAAPGVPAGPPREEEVDPPREEKAAPTPAKITSVPRMAGAPEAPPAPPAPRAGAVGRAPAAGGGGGGSGEAGAGADADGGWSDSGPVTGGDVDGESLYKGDVADLRTMMDTLVPETEEEARRVVEPLLALRPGEVEQRLRAVAQDTEPGSRACRRPPPPSLPY